jgi:hypothetical protein
VHPNIIGFWDWPDIEYFKGGKKNHSGLLWFQIVSTELDIFLVFRRGDWCSPVGLIFIQILIFLTISSTLLPKSQCM